MEKKVHFFYGLLLGLLLATVGMYLYLILFTEYNLIDGLIALNERGHAGKLISLGTIPNLVAFFYFLKKKKEMWARGVVMATIILAISTIFML